ncbi:helix-turn-helix transcriptional regulator [Guyparkeria halophila]|uniref:Helix-turn-helix transcriptional regulator n=1 Tax=Guyparkeria halophila TaxID=47960 RepID=A0ABZ0YY61_9GAMM|nr:helix-turn-helix transcriptional regulator [Guyparkeria halophila]
METYLAGRAEPKASRLNLIVKATGVSGHWLVTGEGEMLASQTGARVAGTAHPGEFATIPLYNVEACAGDGSYVEHEEIATQLSFRRDWIHQEIHANPANLHLIYVRGDSMEPDLQDGEIVMVDTSFADRVPRDGIYVVQIDHQVAVKRLQRLPGDQVKVMSSNRAYEPFTAHLGDGELKVIGKVIWHAGPMG